MHVTTHVDPDGEHFMRIHNHGDSFAGLGSANGEIECEAMAAALNAVLSGGPDEIDAARKRLEGILTMGAFPTT